MTDLIFWVIHISMYTCLQCYRQYDWPHLLGHTYKHVHSVIDRMTDLIFWVIVLSQIGMRKSFFCRNTLDGAKGQHLTQQIKTCNECGNLKSHVLIKVMVFNSYVLIKAMAFNSHVLIKDMAFNRHVLIKVIAFNSHVLIKAMAFNSHVLISVVDLVRHVLIKTMAFNSHELIKVNAI